jgi:hypothetical protein
MATFLVEAYAPGTFDVARAEANARAAADRLSGEGVPVHYLRSILVREDETCFHLIESDTKAGALALMRRASLAFIRISEAHA